LSEVDFNANGTENSFENTITEIKNDEIINFKMTDNVIQQNLTNLKSDSVACPN